MVHPPGRFHSHDTIIPFDRERVEHRRVRKGPDAGPKHRRREAHRGCTSVHLSTQEQQEIHRRVIRGAACAKGGSREVGGVGFIGASTETDRDARIGSDARVDGRGR